MMPRYAGLDLDRALVILDWSGWVRRAWHASGLQVDKTAGIVAGWLARLLSDPMPASLVAAVDPPRRTTGYRAPTFRHRATAHLDEKARYKAGRLPATAELMAAEGCLDELLALHAIPTLTPEDPTREQDWEADDAAAAAVRLAASEGRPCVLVSIDKDWLPLVTTEDPTRPMVICWDPQHDEITDDRAVLTKWSVEPRQITDLLALMGDNGDTIPGVKKIGPKMAASLLWHFGTLDAAIEAAPHHETVDVDKPMRRALRLLDEQTREAKFSRSLVKLWDETPIEWHPPSQVVGGFDVPRLRRLYRDFGHTRLAESVPSFQKAASW
jgi:5'-3' exonuclease